MAHTKQALKRARQSTTRRASHKSERAALKTAMKRLDDALKSGDEARIAVEVKSMQQKVDKAAQHNVMHKNAASRTKSRIAARAKKAVAARPAS